MDNGAFAQIRSPVLDAGSDRLTRCRRVRLDYIIVEMRMGADSYQLRARTVWSTSLLVVTALTMVGLVAWTMRSSAEWHPAGVWHLTAAVAAVVAARWSRRNLWGYRIALVVSVIVFSILTYAGGLPLGWLFLPALVSAVLAVVAEVLGRYAF